MNSVSSAKNGPLAVHVVEGLGLGARQVDALLRDDPEPRRLELGVDRARQVAPGRVGLDDRQGALVRHASFLPPGPPRAAFAAAG
jgi:hypothetical protein